MTAEQLAEELRKRLHLHGGSAYPAVYLFGIEFARELNGQKLREICALADISPNYAAELTKARKLAPFVEIKR